MKRTWILIYLVFILSSSTMVAQQDWPTFKAKAAQYYHVLATPEVSNFSFLISSDFYINFIQDKADSSFYYPLKYIWTRDAQQYFILQPFPENAADSLRRELLVRAQELKNLFSGIMLDWYKYAVLTPVSDVPDDAQVNFSDDTVGVYYTFNDKGQNVEIRETYTQGGQIGRVSWKSGNQKIVTYPLFDEVENKWLCIGWDSQRYTDNNIISGVAVRIELRKEDNYFVPVQFNIMVQTQEHPEKQVVTRIYVKNFTLNEPLEVIQPSGSAEQKNEKGN
ncbi:MAG: hypothetical protein D6748_03935 [Calditrichaeota bacterium]|nr:MAG: hypothetical protein D6748_03935 [Calditrichota bacterium]